MNDWYIDRSKNFFNNTFDPVINFLLGYNGDRDSSVIIDKLISSDVFDEDAGNLHAALTRFRDHGIIDNSNMLGDPAMDYAQHRITNYELAIDLFIKRPATKKNSPNLKPFGLICKVFDLMYELVADEDDVYLTYEECYKYLYKCNSLNDINIGYVDSIIDNRPCRNITLTRNEIINISIWANALRNTPLLVITSENSKIVPNYYAKPFIGFIARNGFKLSETPTNSNDMLYKYYCDREKGINEIIPNIFNDNVVLVNQIEASKVFNYIFGIMHVPDLDTRYYFKDDCFGAFNPFLFVPGLAIRSVWMKNKAIGKSLFEYISRY